MAYEPTNWKAGDIVTSAKLNKIEQGIATGGKIVIADLNQDNTLNKTWQEIHDADISFIKVVDNENIFIMLVTEIGHNTNGYVFTDSHGDTFEADSPNDYPVFIIPDEGNQN